MDPITQATFGAIFAQTQGQKKDLAKAALFGALAGMAPDLDVLIRSFEDSLRAIEYHRHFTHSLIFIPLGALICSGFLHALLGRALNVNFKQSFLWCLLGMATHGLLDSLTSYGTLLFWPFSNQRVAWDIISIIDPLITLPLIGLSLAAILTKQRKYIFLGIAWAFLYFGFSYTQQQKAISEALKLSEKRNVEVLHIEAKPSLANIFIWKVITTTEDKYYVDAVKIGPGKSIVWEGENINKLSIERDLPWLKEGSQQRKDIERFRWFSNGYIALDRNNPYQITDIRYSFLPQKINPLWGIELKPEADKDAHAKFYNARHNREGVVKTLWGMLLE